jgi:Ran GTPase-activating protein (RanGAP) involved in mRNA processing and transport
MGQKRTEYETIKLNELTKVKKESELELKELKQRLNAEVEGLSKQKNDLTNRLAEARERVATL